MKRRFFGICMGLGLCCIPVTTMAAGNTIYVSANGSNQNDGTETNPVLLLRKNLFLGKRRKFLLH